MSAILLRHGLKRERLVDLRASARCATILLLVLAILVGPGVSAMSMAATMPAIGMSGPDSDEGCKGCLANKMTLADCGMVCVALPAIIAPVAAFSTGVEHSPWRWDDEQVGRDPTKPPTAPPRSLG
jgi:hypothetical protein